MLGNAGDLLADNPFITFRQYLDVYHHALHRGLTDAAYIDLVAAADQRVAEVDGHGFRTTPLVELSLPPGILPQPMTLPVMAKVETGNVSGSHKARHLFGLLLRLLIDDELATTGLPDLAIASCGNAALGAAVMARSAGRRLRVFVPVDADPVVLDRLGVLGAEVEVCPRRVGATGDPCLDRLGKALSAGAVPFTVQGPLCPDVIDGGRTLGLELGDQLAAAGLAPSAIYVQVGGGALATAVMDGLARGGRLARQPRLHPVQARAAHPYVAGWQRIAPHLFEALGMDDPGDGPARGALLTADAERLAPLALPDGLARWSEMMTPWPGTPRSVASGILDDEAYDWTGVMTHQITTGGWPVLVDEDTFRRAAALVAKQISPPPDATGAAGLAGLLVSPPLRADLATNTTSTAGIATECAVVLLTGADRHF